MGRQICTVEGCDKPVNGFGLCSGHYHRWKRGRPLDDRPISRRRHEGCAAPSCDGKHHSGGWCKEHRNKVGYGREAKPKPSREELFWSKVEKTETCWNWTASTTRGYGTFGIDGRKTCPAHRYAYELLVGSIPHGMQLDHRCHNRRCVNPEHLRVVSPGQNNQNHNGAKTNSKSGVRGVSRCGQTGKWVAFVAHRGEQWHVGRFETIEEAEAAVIAKRNELHTHNDRDRKDVA